MNILRLYKDAYSGFSRAIWALTIISFINRAGTMVMLFMSLYLQNELGFSFQNIGIIMSCFGVGSLIGSFLGGYFTDRLGFYNVMIISLLIASIGFIGLIFQTNFYSICAFVIFTSCFADAFRPASYVAVKVYSTEENQTRSMAMMRLAINLGFSVGPFIGGVLIELLGFHWVFILDGLTCFLAAFSIKLLLPRKSNIIKNKNKSSLKTMTKNRKYILFLSASFLLSLSFFQVFTILPIYMGDAFKMSESAIGFLLALNGFIIVIMEMPLVSYLESSNNKLRNVFMGASFITASYVLLAFDFTFLFVPYLFMIMITMGEMINFPFASSWALDQSNGENAGAYMSLYTMTFSCTHIIAPLISYYLADHYGYQVMWSFFAVVCILSLFIFNRLKLH